MATLNVHLQTIDTGGNPQKVRGSVVPLKSGTHLLQAAQWLAQLQAHAEEDIGWDWSEILKEARGNEMAGVGTWECYALECARELQALMLIERSGHLSRQSGAGLVYVEYLSVAPWNRRRIQDPPRFAGCGIGMISMAVERSHSIGFGGAIGLHSLAGAFGFYQRLGLADLGPDAEEGGLHYFEST